MRNSILSCHVVADFFLMQEDQNAGDAITNLKLQKLVYYAQAWHLAMYGVPLFFERIKAWAHGPVVPDLWHRFKRYRWDAIDPGDLRSDPYADLSGDDIAFLDQVWGEYGGFTGKQLERMTHSEAPWRIAYGDTPPGGACEEEITHKDMREFYGARLKVA